MKCINCKFCEYTVKDDSTEFQGCCHRFPPTVLGSAAEFPSIFQDDWCGEFQRGTSHPITQEGV
jgi:hypothetical protein